MGFPPNNSDESSRRAWGLLISGKGFHKSEVVSIDSTALRRIGRNQAGYDFTVHYRTYSQTRSHVLTWCNVYKTSYQWKIFINREKLTETITLLRVKNPVKSLAFKTIYIHTFVKFTIRCNVKDKGKVSGFKNKDMYQKEKLQNNGVTTDDTTVIAYHQVVRWLACRL